MPLTVKVPLLMSAILVIVLGTALVATYSTLRSSSLDRARDRLVRTTRQLASVGAANIAAAHTEYAGVATDSLVRAALRNPRVDPRPALARLVEPTDSGMPVELWSADGRRVAFLGNDIAATMRVERGRPELPERIVRAVAPQQGGEDSLRLTPLYSEGSNIHFWFVMPVRQNNRVLGYITHQRRITPRDRTQGAVRELSGEPISVYYRNVDGTFWSTGWSVATAPYEQPDYAAGTARQADGERVIFDEERVGSSPIMVGLSMPESAVLAQTHRLIQPLLLLALLLLVGGTVAAWLIGRSMTRPVARVTQAARALATGDYSVRVPARGDPEVRLLAESFNEMADEIDASRKALEAQTRAAQAANNAKSDFLTTMSHELRTPLNAIGGYVDLLELELRGPVSPAQKRDLERIKASQQHLLGLISGVLDLARVEAGKVTYDLANVAVDPFLSGLDALIAPQAAAKHITLEHEPGGDDLVVRADREKLRQILLNLLSNAIRHTPSGGRVILAAEPVGGRVRIIVEDTGPGIPAERRDEIFEPFVQLDRSLTQSREGLGLGLAISRDLARGMSGELAVDPHDGPGARFVLTLARGVADGSTATMSGEMPVVR